RAEGAFTSALPALLTSTGPSAIAKELGSTWALEAARLPCTPTRFAGREECYRVAIWTICNYSHLASSFAKDKCAVRSRRPVPLPARRRCGKHHPRCGTRESRARRRQHAHPQHGEIGRAQVCTPV